MLGVIPCECVDEPLCRLKADSMRFIFSQTLYGSVNCELLKLTEVTKNFEKHTLLRLWVIEGYRIWHQPKGHMRLPFGGQPRPYLARFRSYGDLLVKTSPLGHTERPCQCSRKPVQQLKNVKSHCFSGFSKNVKT